MTRSKHFAAVSYSFDDLVEIIPGSDIEVDLVFMKPPEENDPNNPQMLFEDSMGNYCFKEQFYFDVRFYSSTETGRLYFRVADMLKMIAIQNYVANWQNPKNSPEKQQDNDWQKRRDYLVTEILRAVSQHTGKEYTVSFEGKRPDDFTLNESPNNLTTVIW